MRNEAKAGSRGTIRWPNLKFIALFTATALLGAGKICAQEQAEGAKESGTEIHSPVVQKGAKAQSETHRFVGKQNGWLFAGIGAARTLDYFSTLNMRRRGRQEILLTNEVVDNHAAFAAIEAAGTGVSIGAAYLFHRYGHHKLERWTSIAHIGLATAGAVHNYCLKTAHPATTP